MKNKTKKETKLQELERRIEQLEREPRYIPVYPPYPQRQPYQDPPFPLPQGPWCRC